MGPFASWGGAATSAPTRAEENTRIGLAARGGDGKKGPRPVPRIRYPAIHSV